MLREILKDMLREIGKLYLGRRPYLSRRRYLQLSFKDMLREIGNPYLGRRPYLSRRRYLQVSFEDMLREILKDTLREIG